MIGFADSFVSSFRKRLLRRVAAAAALGLALVAITASYLEPGFVVTVANQLWTCF
jgi:hypothetical protein